MRKNWLIIVLMVLGISCEEATDWHTSQGGELPDLIVDGIFTNKRSIQAIRLTKPMTQQNQIPEAVSGADVLITDRENFIRLFEDPQEPGLYKTQAEVRGVAGRRYFLRIEWENNLYTASDSMVPLSTEDPLSLVTADSSGWYMLHYQELGRPAMIDVSMNWEHLSDTCQDFDCQARQLFYVLYNIDVNEAFSWGQEQIIFPAGTRLIRKKYSLSPRHQSFIRSLLMETDWRGGIFDVLPGNVLTNVSNGGAGFFGTCTVHEDTVYVGQ